MKISEKETGVLIEFGNKLKTGIKIILFFCALSSISAGLYFSKEFYHEVKKPYPSTELEIIAVIFAIIFYFVFWRYLKRIMTKESILITTDTFRIINRAVYTKREKLYEIDKISDFIYKGKAPKTDHPLKLKSFDVLGFETQELVIAEVHDEGNLSFQYNGKTVYFGKNVYSWDADEINVVLLRVTNGQLKIENLSNEVAEEDSTLQTTPETN